jgi:hypothetical protein
VDGREAVRPAAGLPHPLPELDRPGHAARPPDLRLYEDYARVVGGILDAAAITGFLANRIQGRSPDRESLRWAALVEKWAQERGQKPTSAADLHALIFFEKPGVWDAEGNVIDPGIAADINLQVAFADILGEGKELSQKQKLGHALRKQEDRVWAGHRIVRSGAKGLGGTLLYKVVPLDPPPSAGVV